MGYSVTRTNLLYNMLSSLAGAHKSIELPLKYFYSLTATVMHALNIFTWIDISKVEVTEHLADL